MNRAELVKLVGEFFVKELESVNCELTSRLMQPHEDHLIEYCAGLDCEDVDGNKITIEAYYYIDKEWIESLGEGSDRYEEWASWDIAHYQVL